MRNSIQAPSQVIANRYVLTDPRKREYPASDHVEIDRLLAEMRKEFGDSFKFKIRVNRDAPTMLVETAESECIV